MPGTAHSLPAPRGVRSAPASTAVRWHNVAGPPRVATPITTLAPPPPPVVPSELEGLVLEFPEPALVFDQDALCTCLNNAAAQALGVNPDHAVGLDAAALRLPAEIAEAMRAITKPQQTAMGREREILSGHGTGVRRFHATPHPATHEVLLTWSDLVSPQEAARQLAALQESIRRLGTRTVADGRRRGEVVARLGAELEQTVAAMGAASEELTAQGWGLPPGRAVGDVLAEESRRLRAVLEQLAELRRELCATQAALAGDVIEL